MPDQSELGEEGQLVVRPVFRVSLLAGVIGAMAVVAVPIIDMYMFDVPEFYDTDKFVVNLPTTFAIALLVGTAMSCTALLTLGLPVAHLMGRKLAGIQGVIASLIVAAFGCVIFYAIVVEQPFSSAFDPISMITPACFALPAALLYRREILRERALGEAAT